LPFQKEIITAPFTSFFNVAYLRLASAGSVIGVVEPFAAIWQGGCRDIEEVLFSSIKH
jgi:hypothetical protein